MVIYIQFETCKVEDLISIWTLKQYFPLFNHLKIIMRLNAYVYRSNHQYFSKHFEVSCYRNMHVLDGL